ncbi:hypothetical protein BSLG_007424 [Batrachochytrium salamandrivorans]|nr:hypothetical protein BSLG_007424 [Batrachochytrium salamandrivorans]
MASQKQQVIEAILDSNRQKGQWDSLRDNLAKFHRKLVANVVATNAISSSLNSLGSSSSGSSALQQLLLGEVAFQLMSTKFGTKEQIPYDRGPELIYIPSPYLDAVSLTGAIHHLEKAISIGQSQASTQDLQQIWANQAHILLGRIDLGLGKVHEALQHFLLAEFPNPLPQSSGSYARTMINEIEKPQEQEPDQWTIWAEELLFSMSMDLIRASDVNSACRSMSLYIQVVASTPFAFVPTKKIAIYRHHIFYLFAGLSLVSPFSGIPSFGACVEDTTPISDKAAIVYNQIRICLRPYEKLVTTLLSFPRGEDSSRLSLERYARVLEMYDFWVKLEVSYTRCLPNTPSALIDQFYCLIETLYRGTKHTFHSLRILRYISHSFLSILIAHSDNVCNDERKEAQHAVSTYLFYWEKKSSLILEIERKKLEDQKMSMSRPIRSDESHIAQKVHAVSLADNAMQDKTPSIIPSNDTSSTPSDVNRIELPVAVPSEEKPLDILEKLDRDLESDSDKMSSVVVDGHTHIQLSDVDGDTPLDAIGVLITGMRILLLTHEGNSEMLEQAAIYGEKAYSIAIKYTAHLPEERRLLQSQAIAMLQKATAMDSTDPIMHYQLALQLAEVGEFADAIDAINQSIEIKSDFPNAYNLLSLILNSKSQTNRALQVVQEGWRACAIKYAKTQLVKVRATADSHIESMIKWDYVPIELREDLINLKLTQVALENEQFGPRVSIDTLYGLFNLFRNVIGIPPGCEDRSISVDGVFQNTDIAGVPEIRVLSHMNSANSVTSSLGASPRATPTHMGSNGVPLTTSLTKAQPYRYRTYDLLISLWLTTSAVYRELGNFDGSRQAIEEAEQLVEQLAKLEQNIRSSSSRILRDQPSNVSESNSSLGSLQTNHMGKGRTMKSSKSRRTPSTDARLPLQKWGFANRGIRRILADIAFEQSMMKYDIYTLQNKPPTVSKYSKYLSPVATVEAERRLQLRQNARMPNSRSNASISSSITSSTANINGDKAQTDDDTNSLFALELEIQEGFLKVHSASTDELAPNTNTRASIMAMGVTASMGDTRSTLKSQQSFLASCSHISIDHIIKSVKYITVIDPDHLPSCVHLGILFLEKGDIGQAEHWLSRACNQAKSRGAGGGRTGMTTIYGGATAAWAKSSVGRMQRLSMAMDGPTEEKNATDGIDTCQRDIYDDGSNADHRSINNQDCEPENNHHYGEIEESEGDSSSVGADQASSHMHAESGVLIPSWKVIHHQIEKKIARYFGSAKVNEARRKVQLLASQRQPGTAAVAHGRSVVAAGHAVSHLETALWESQTMVVGGQIPADGSVSGRADMMHACSHLTEKPDNKEMMVNQPSFSLPRHLSCSSGSAYKKERDPMFSNRSGGSLLLADGLDEADKADGLDGSDGSDTVASTDANHLNIILPHGCQLMRTIYHPNASFKMILYMIGETDRFASLDTNHVHLWRGPSHVLKMSVLHTKDSQQQTSVTGLNHWVYIQKWQLTIISTRHLEIKILDAGLKCLSSISTPKPAVSLEFVNKYDEIVVGSVGAVMIRNKSLFLFFSAGKMVCCRTPRLVISDLQIDEWVTFSAFDDARDYLYTVYENNFNIYNYKTGHRVDTVRNAHESPISAVLFYDPQGLFITGSKDSTIKVWNRQNYLLYVFKEHTSIITGLCRVLDSEKSGKLFFMSCSLDKSLRIWNLDSGRQVYKNPIVRLLRSKILAFPSRIFAASLDGSMSIISPRTGERLITAFPIMADTVLVDAIYDSAQDCTYMLTENGDITVHSSRTNPFTIIEEWKYYGIKIIYLTCGQIVYRDVRQKGKQEFLVQAHTSTNIILLPTKDSTVKIWTIEYTESSNGTSKIWENTQHSDFKGPVYLFVRQLENHPRDDDHTHEITGIACLETPLYCVFATSSQDGTVKVWDAVHNILIREMQFSDTTKSICFANPRGDLLVGISDQIALVQVHDYLPEKYLLMLSESHWPDDLIEAPMELDSGGPDFGYLNDSTGTMNRYRLISKEQAHSYIPFDEMPYKAQRRRFFDDDGQEVVKYDIPEMEFDVLMKDNERISERIRPHSTNILEPIGGPRPGSSYSTVFKYDKKSLGIAALDIAQRAINGANQSEFRLLPQKEAVPTFDLGKPRALEVSRGRVLDVLERARTRKMKQDDQDRKRLEALMGDAKPAPNQKMARRKGWILDSMIKSGVAPNSVISGDVDRMQHLVREQQRRDQEKQFQISEAEALKKAPRIDVLDTNYCSKDTSLLGAEHRKSTLNKESSSCRSSTSSIEARPTWGTGIPILETRKGRKKSIAKYELQAIENDSDDYDPSKYKKRTSRAPSVVHQRKSLRTPPTDEEDRSVIKLLVEEKALPLLTEDEIGRVSASLSSQSIEDRVDDPDPSRAIEMTTTGTESDGNPVAQSSLDYALKDDLLVTDKGCIIDAGNSHHSLLASKTSSLDEFSNSKIVGDDFKTSIIPGLATPPDPDTYELHNNSRDNIGNDLDSKTMKPFTPIEFPCGIEVAEEIETASTLEKSSSRDYDFEPVLHTFLSDKITSKLAWDLFKSVVVHPNEDNAQGRVFSQFKSTDWFHGIENAETNVTNIVASLCETLRSGALKDKIQAAKGMMYMYYTFKDDMSDPLEQIINPQLEQIHDSNWQVRAQLICNLTSFEKFDENIILEMIMALADPHPKVVQAAINGLISFGISSTEALRCAMIQFHMIIPTKEEHAMPVILLNNMESQLQGIHSPELVKDYSHIVQWLTHVDKRVYGHPFIRPDSSVVTMCEHSRRILPRKGRYEEPCNTRLIPANTRSGSESTTDKLNSPLQAKLAYSHSQSHTLARTNQHQTTRTYFPTIGRLGAQMHSSTSK